MFSCIGRTRLRGRGALVAAGLAVAVLLVGCGSASPSANTSHGTTTARGAAVSGPFYVALGDSLAFGIQPNAKGQQLASGKGYVDDVYARLKARIPGLKLIQDSCPGDSTTSLLTGRGNSVAAAFYKCNRTGGSQLQAALSFIRAHRSQVKLVTIDIGANDIIPCVSPSVFAKGAKALESCVGTGQAQIVANLPKILGPLKAAVAPGTVLVGGTVYDPFLTGVEDQDTTVKDIAEASLPVFTQINHEITTADAAAGFRTAEVADAFSYNVATAVTSAKLGTQVPKAVAVLCDFSYMCVKAPQGPNIHPTTTGYRAMATAFEQQLGSL
jgi:lysophospholipase L1-like esterase